MTAHECKALADGCYRCELGKDEAEAALNELRQDIERAIWKAPAEKLWIIEAVLDL